MDRSSSVKNNYLRVCGSTQTDVYDHFKRLENALSICSCFASPASGTMTDAHTIVFTASPSQRLRERNARLCVWRQVSNETWGKGRRVVRRVLFIFWSED
jgi:hypothetical protein